jgi:hypothetical protein
VQSPNNPSERPTTFDCLPIKECHGRYHPRLPLNFSSKATNPAIAIHPTHCPSAANPSCCWSKSPSIRLTSQQMSHGRSSWSSYLTVLSRGYTHHIKRLCSLRKTCGKRMNESVMRRLLVPESINPVPPRTIRRDYSRPIDRNLAKIKVSLRTGPACRPQ